MHPLAGLGPLPRRVRRLLVPGDWLALWRLGSVDRDVGGAGTTKTISTATPGANARFPVSDY